MDLNLVIVVLYLVAMLGFGFWGRSRTQNSSDYLVAGRRLGTFLYTGTMAAVVLGGASTVGGVGLGYKMGLSGMWLVVAIGVGVLLLSLLFAGTISKLRVYTVSDMLKLRYGSKSAAGASSIVMMLYTMFLVVTSTGAYATVLHVLTGLDSWICIAIGGAVVLVYSVIGGMWSITLADQVQFIIKTIGIFALMLPFVLVKADGFSGIRERLGDDYFAIAGGKVGADTQTIITWFVVYMFGMLIGQDIWQRVFTARTPKVARLGGTMAGVYCILYGAAGAIIGMGAHAVLGDGIKAKNDVYAEVADKILPVGIGGLVLAAAVAAMMSTASGALIACATVARNDVVPFLTGRARAVDDVAVDTYSDHDARALKSTGSHAANDDASDPHSEKNIRENRAFVLGLGVLTVLISILMARLDNGGDLVVASLTVAYDILVGGLLVAILGGFVWKRANGTGAAISMLVGTLVTVAGMVYQANKLGDTLSGILANEPIYYGLIASLVTFVVASLATPKTDDAVRAEWDARVHRPADVELDATPTAR